jgi:hypothetical protein
VTRTRVVTNRMLRRISKPTLLEESVVIKHWDGDPRSAPASGFSHCCSEIHPAMDNAS